MIETNEFQTPLTDEFIDSLPQEVREELLTYIDSVPFIKGLISPDRKRAKDLPRDEEGKIIIDFTHPHILEDMEYFRPAGNYYRKHGVYTKLTPNANPQSEFGKWLTTEIDRIWNGMVRPSDGEWIPGELYFYWNYTPIKVAREVSKGSKQADRVEDFPDIWEATYLLAHYLAAGRKEGLHGAVIASRGKGKSFYLASALARLFTCGDNKKARKKVLGIVTAYQKEYLVKDGTLNKFVAIIDFLAKTTQFPRARYKSSFNEMNWVMGYVPSSSSSKAIEGTQNEVLGVSSKDNSDNLRGKRATRLFYEEFGRFPKFINTWNTNLYNVQEGEYVFGEQVAMGTGGTEGSDFSGALELIYHPTGYFVKGVANLYDKGTNGATESVFFMGAYLNEKGYYNKDGVSDVVGALVSEIKARIKIKYNSSDPTAITQRKAEKPFTIQEAVMRNNSTIYPVADLVDRILEIDQNPRFMDDLWVGQLALNKGKVAYKVDLDSTPIINFPHKDNKLKGAVIIAELPIKNSDGEVPRGRYIAGCLLPGELVNTNTGLKKVEDITVQDKLINIEGQEVDIYNTQVYNNTNSVYTVKLANIIDPTTFSEEHPIYCCTPKRRYHSHNKVKNENVSEKYYEYNFQFKKVSELKEGDYVKSPILFSEECKLDSEFNTPEIWYLLGVILGNGWIQKNHIHIAFNAEEVELINRCKKIILSQFGVDFKIVKAEGTRIEYNFKHSKFSEFFTEYFNKHTEDKYIDYRLKSVPKELRKNLILGYIDTNGCITNNAVNIVSTSKRLLCDIQDWLFSLGIVSSVKVLRKENIYYIKDRTCNTHITYQLNIETEGLNSIKEWNLPNTKIDKYKPVRILNHNRNSVFIKDNYIYLKVQQITTSPYIGKIYNFECETHTFMCNYIPTHNCDPYDDDASNTLSLGSIYILDLWTDRLVFEYTGRPMFANEFYEVCRRALLMYNAECNYENNKKGLFTYFSEHNCLYLLSPTLDFLKDRELIKGNFYGNKAYGTNTSEPIKAYARRCIRDWLLKPVEVEVTNETGETETITRPQLFDIPYRALLQELQLWSADGNFDRHDALGMLMLLREDKLRLLGGREPSTTVTDTNYLGNDDFFNKNYKKDNLSKYSL